jgi:hypothetical protein
VPYSPAPNHGYANDDACGLFTTWHVFACLQALLDNPQHSALKLAPEHVSVHMALACGLNISLKQMSVLQAWLTCLTTPA